MKSFSKSINIGTKSFSLIKNDSGRARIIRHQKNPTELKTFGNMLATSAHAGSATCGLHLFSNQNEKFDAYGALGTVQLRKILQEILILNSVSCLTLLDTSHVTLFPEPRCSTNAMRQFTPQDSPGRAWGVVIPCAGDFVRQRGLQHDSLG